MPLLSFTWLCTSPSYFFFLVRLPRYLCLLHSYAPLPTSFLPPKLSFLTPIPPSLHVASSCPPCPTAAHLLTLVSDSSSSDGHTDSAFGESIVSSSSVSTPVGGLSSNRFNPTSSAATSHDEEPGNDLVSQQSSSSNLQESTPVHVQEAQEDEEAGYARLEDIRSAQESKEKARYCIRIFACLVVSY